MDWERAKPRLDALLSSGRRGELRGALMMLNEVDIAEYLQSLDTDKVLLVFRILPKDVSAEVFTYMDTDQRQRLISSIGDGEIRALIDEMFLDDAVDFLEELPANIVTRVLRNTDETTRNLINQFLRYPENSAGSIMTIEYCAFRASETVQNAMAELKRTGVDKETIYTLYIIDESRRLLGTLPLRHLIMANDDQTVGELMDTNVISVTTLDDQEHAAELVHKYDFIAIPVVDTENRLVGIITIDDIVDVIEDEATEDIEKMAALLPSEDEYFKTSVWKMVGNRIPWLVFMMISAILSGKIINYFEGVLQSSAAVGVALTACIPMLMGTGGNCGSQSSTLTIRGLALGDIHLIDVFRLLWKEIRVAVIVGAILSVLNYFIQIVVNHVSSNVAVVVSVAVFLTVMLSKSIGCTLPLLAKRCHLDPALMASPLITTIVDACSLTILFVIATRFLPL